MVLDLYRAHSAADYLMRAVGLPASKAIRLVKTGALHGLQQSPEVKRAWEEHYATHACPTIAECAGPAPRRGYRGRGYEGTFSGVTP